MSQPDINSAIIIAILVIVITFVINYRRILQKLKKGTVTPEHYLNTQARLKAVEFAPNGLVTIDEAGLVVAWNMGATNMFGYSEKEMIGRSLSIITPERYRQMYQDGLLEARIKGKLKINGKPIELYGLTRNKVEFPIKVTASRWMEGGYIFYTGIIADITERHEREVKVANVLSLYQTGEEIDEMGTWNWDVLEDKVTVTEGFKRIFNVDKDILDSGYLLRKVHYEDLPQVEEKIKKAFENKEGYTMDYRVVASNGNLIPVQVHAKAFLDKRGQLTHITGTIHKLPKS